MREEVYIRLLSLPSTIKGMTLVDPDGNYNIYINQNLSRNQQRKALQHEMRHVRQGDCYSEKSIRHLEFD